MVTQISSDNFRLIPPNCMVGQACVLRQSRIFFFFYKRRPPYDALSNVYQTDDWSVEILVITVTGRNRINSVGMLFFRDRILRFSKNIPSSLKRYLSNLNVFVIQNSLGGFRNALNVRNNSKTSRWFLLIGSFTGCSCNRRYHQRLCLEAQHINSAHALLNREDGSLLPDAYLHLVRIKGSQLESI